jgi:hypothetical protein
MPMDDFFRSSTKVREPAPPNPWWRACDANKRMAEQQGIAYAKTVAEAMNLKLDADNPADREKLRRAVLDLVAGKKMPKQKGASLSR